MIGIRFRAGLLIVPLAAAALLSLPAAAGEDLPGTSPLDPEARRSLVAIETALAKLRGLPFKSEVATAALTHEGAREYIRKVLRTEYPGGKLAEEQEAMRYFRLIPAGRDLETLYLDLLQAQVAGLYDPPTKTLYVVEGPLSGTVALAHELAHALMDQHFDLEALEKRARDDDDRSLALSSLIEGEATMEMVFWTVQQGTGGEGAGPMGGDPADMLKASQAGMEGVPPFLRETLLFPYVSGMAWAGAVMRHGGGLKALDEYFREPPESSEQILHPEKSLPPRDLPSAIDPALAGAGIPAAARVVKRDTMGEFGIRFLLGGAGSPRACEAAEGWDGDLYVLAGTAGAYLLNWVSVWDTEEDADQFAAAVGGWLRDRSDPGPSTSRSAAERKGRVVVVTEGDGSAPSGAARERAASILARLPSGIDLR